jgi:upstream activation factor subunit UAF30
MVGVPFQERIRRQSRGQAPAPYIGARRQILTTRFLRGDTGMTGSTKNTRATPAKGASTTSKPAAKASAKTPAKAADAKPAKAAQSAFTKPLQPSAALAAVVGSDPLPRTEVVSKMWEYIKKHKLQNEANKREILADEKLTAVFGKDKVTMFEMNKFLAQHLK